MNQYEVVIAIGDYVTNVEAENIDAAYVKAGQLAKDIAEELSSSNKVGAVFVADVQLAD